MKNNSIDEFKQLLNAENSDYYLAGEPTAQVMHFQFIGPFLGREVIWHAQLLTLQEYNQQHKLQLDSQQMDIKAIDRDNYQITIILKLPRLNTASVLMSIKMVRQYKRLGLGRHNWN